MATILVALAAVPVAPLAAYLAYSALSQRVFLARTPFVADLGSHTIADEETLFASRTERAFPAGSSPAVLQATLAAQGFSALPPYDGFESRLHVERASFPCRVAWDVLWSARNGAVSAIRGDMKTTCL